MIRFYLSQYEKENYVIESLYDGCEEEKELVSGFDYEPSDVAVVMGVFKKYVPASYGRGRVIHEQKKNGGDCLILETGYINRGDGPTNHYALGWNGLNGRADFKNKNSPSDRSLGVALKPWRDGDYVLLAGQVPWDASVDFTNHREWLEEAANNIRAVSGREIVFRPHPKGDLPSIDGCRYSKGPLGQDLLNAHCVVTFNSNTGVDAVIDGVPVFAFDVGAMTYPIANKNWLKLENPEKPDRRQWLNDLSYCQWTPDEMRSGEAWAHIGYTASTQVLKKELSRA
jgi:hypothetical protein